jgi:CheY-like chemotaxis protein
MQVPSESLKVAAPPRRPHVLVVDDDPGIRALCVAALESEGYDVSEAGDGREGLARAVAERPDLVVCDVTMPVLDGFGFAVALRQHEATRLVPVVFLTGESEPAVEQHAFDTGALGFFSKPFEPHALSTFVRSVLAHLEPGFSVRVGGHAT